MLEATASDGSRRVKGQWLWLVLAAGVAVCVRVEAQHQPRAPTTAPPKVDVPELKMVLIPAGEFTMGSTDEQLLLANEMYPSEAYEQRETPAHTVHVDAFLIDNCEVTVAQFQAFCAANDYPMPEQPEWSGDEYPVVNVIWHEARAYARWAGKRLPTEAEWEKAARGGLEQKMFPWGDDALHHVYANLVGPEDGFEFAGPVGSFAPNGYGLYDMCGNVWEWVADWYGEDYYAKSPSRNPAGPPSHPRDWRVFRGGGWKGHHPPRRTGCAYRGRGSGGRPSEHVGFRCAKTQTAEDAE
ncbi:MAG: formylglycine-generating enzyme family protein [Armatimonadota bacterium]|jgi:formylglycine-generating enzyme required for sulfatase activity